MRYTLGIVLTLVAFVLPPLPALADDVRPAPVSYASLNQDYPVAGSGDTANSRARGEDPQLDLRKADFFRFAQEKIREMNRNLNLSRERMQISREADGSYRARFHQIDDSSMSLEVSRSSSRSIPYVAVLSYREEVYDASCPTPEQCRQEQFVPVGFIPNRHIFSYSNGAWN